MHLPSGRQHELVYGDQRAVAVEVGGGIRSYSVGGFEVLDGYAAHEMCSAARGQPLIPWPNRIADGRYRFAGADEQLPLTEPERRTAIHGLLRWVSWERTGGADDRVVLEAVLHPQPGYPFALVATAEYRLGPGGLSVTLSARNPGEQPLPYGAGQHPYLRVAAGPIDDALLRSPAGTRLLADERGIPTGERVPVGGEFDLRRPQPIGERVLDTAFGDLERDAGGRARVELSGPQRRVTLWMDAGFRYLMLFTGDTLAPERRRRGLGVEPMTCPPNAFQTGEAVQVLAPGQATAASWGIEVDVPPPGSPDRTD